MNNLVANNLPIVDTVKMSLIKPISNILPIISASLDA